MRLIVRQRLTWLAIGSALAFVAGIAGAGATALLGLLSTEQKFSLVGSALGSFLAAVTAVGAIEYQARRDTARRRRILLDLLARLDMVVREELDEDENGPPLRTRVEVLKLALQQVLQVAHDLRSLVPGSAGALLYLQNLDTLLDDILSKEGPVSPARFAECRKSARYSTVMSRDLLD